MFNPDINNVNKVNEIIQTFEEQRDLYTILDLDEHCPGGVLMVGQVHVYRTKSKDNFTLWLTLPNDNGIAIKDALVSAILEYDESHIATLFSWHMQEFMASPRWSKSDPNDVHKSWIRWLEDVGLIVIKQTNYGR